MVELTGEGFPAEAFAWYEALGENNTKAWFEDNRVVFERAVRGPMMALMAHAEGEFGGVVKLSRPHRDVRFSKDKSPYKTNLFAVIHSRVDADTGAPKPAGLYVSVSSEGVVAGTGYHEMSSDQLTRYREALRDGGFAQALADAVEEVQETMEVRGRSLKTAPKGYPRDHPHIELLRMKEVIAVRRFPKEICGAGLDEAVFAAWRAAQPINDWLDVHVGASELSPQERFGRR